MSYSTTLFPRPPPTHNTLTLAERSQLLRSNAKIGQLLGSTPHVIDDIRPVVAISAKKTRRKFLPSSTLSNTSQSPTPSLSGSTLDLTSRSSCESSSSTVSSASSRSATVLDAERSWRVRAPFSSFCRPPLLCIGKTRSRSGWTSSSGSSCSESGSSPERDNESDKDDGYEWDVTSMHATPMFSIPSASALRRQKMARLRKRLGEDVPVHLVFPATVQEDEDADDSDRDGCRDRDDKDDSDDMYNFTVIHSPTLSACPTISSQRAKSPTRSDAIFRPDPRRSRFAPLSQSASSKTVRPKVVAVHYTDAGTHGFESETFKALTFRRQKIATIPEE